MPVLLAACVLAAAQTTTISGTVYDPRGASGLPLPNILVYASTTTVAAPTAGVQCVTAQERTPTGSNLIAYTYTDFQGKFTLQSIPVNASYTIVIQAGKWQRQFPETVAATPLTGLALSMPANYTQGSMPMIAIATGQDRMECLFRDMGVSDAEFTDDTETVNPQGRIHLYEGDGNNKTVFLGGLPGAVISPSTPSEDLLLEDASTTPMSAYDMVMLPSQIWPATPPVPGAVPDLSNYADSGGRILANEISYGWVEAPFPLVAVWGGGMLRDAAGPATLQTNFSDGATLARWLQNSGATVAGISDQVDIYTMWDVASAVNPPTQSWATLNNGILGFTQIIEPVVEPGVEVPIIGNPVMQMTFDTPLGAPASSQCGRVWYADFDLVDGGVFPDTGIPYPIECASYNNPSYTMSTTEKMLEYEIFDVNSPPQPVGPPSITLNTSASPTLVNSPVWFQANVAFYASTPTGTMTFYDGTTELGTAALSGYSATFTTAKLAVGAHSITAVYSGDAGYNGPDTSNAVTENVQDFSLTFAGPSSVTAPPAGKAVYTLTITPLGGATLLDAVRLSAIGFPKGATVTFSPDTVPANSGTSTVTLTLALPGSSATNERPRSPFRDGRLPMALGLVLLPFLGKLRKGRARLARLAVLVVIGAALTAGVTGCDGTFTPPPHYSFTVIAASGLSLAHSITPQLTVRFTPENESGSR